MTDRPLGITDAQLAALRERPWCEGCHETDVARLRVTRMLYRARDGRPSLMCMSCLVAWYESGLEVPGELCHRGDGCPACAELRGKGKRP